MEDMRRIKVDIHQWLVDRDVSRWSLINDGGFRFGVMTTNAAESFNGVLKRARGLPIQALITAIYYNIISMFMRRLEFIAMEEQQNNNLFVPRVQTLLKKLEEEARRMPEPIRLNLNEFQVVDMSSRSYRVDILDGRRCKCSCEKPMLYHSPCLHVMLKGVPNKERFDEESRRIHASIARAGDTLLEQKANANEIFRCCLHKWSEEEDDRLWAIHAELIVMRYHELKCHRDEGYSPPDLDCSDLDHEHVIFYRSWCSRYDKLIKNFYKDRMKEVTPDGQLREFFKLEDWQDLQYEFECKMSCCPTQSQLQSHQRRRRKKRTTGEHSGEGTSEAPPPAQIHPNIASLLGTHRAAHPDGGTILEAASHLLMVHDWPVNCPRFMEALRLVGLDCVSQMRYLRMDHHLLTALVERWSPQTNSFHLTVGEMTITLQDVAMILGVHIDGPALVGHPVVEAGRRWLSWPDCCDDLLGSHPLPDVVYRDPFDHRITSRFHMGQAHSQTCVPLR
ncbi:hypothetical protein KFK09_019826 [Dendrobium nobile]|uniref:SWIM-type domain-containing protein n=1 Tax=Dendrobium nobile TaxID=94219 RepID=A0A8T3AS75_DENNO|nr:hypothetical protein KFK09_019826 [Dendrobium nobile]